LDIIDNANTMKNPIENGNGIILDCIEVVNVVIVLLFV
jgi:hypothetical protein